MVRGVCFKENNAENVFLHLHTLMDISKYDWYIDDVDLNYFFFRPGKYSGSEFKEVLDTISTLSFARIRRYPVGMPVDCIDEYEDYVKSSCDFLILFYDGGFYEIYEKEPTMISKTFNFCLDYRFQDVAYIYDAANERTYMHF